MTVLVTGAAGFIGSHTCERLVLALGHDVIGVDNLDPFYPPEVKRQNLAALYGHERFRFLECDIRDLPSMLKGSADHEIHAVVHLAALAGVRPSIERPADYVSVNVGGTTAVLEFMRARNVQHLVFASSSSVYGNSPTAPFKESQDVGAPISPYAATKRAGELIAHTYHHLYDLSVMCLRFFTVYGPRQRPDLAIHKFARLIAAGRNVPIFGDGSTERDYTYIDDIVGGVVSALHFVCCNRQSFEIVNLGGNRTTSVLELATAIAAALKMELRVDHLPLQPGDVVKTWADVTKAERLLGYSPKTAISNGIPRFVDWFMNQAVSTVTTAESALSAQQGHSEANRPGSVHAPAAF